MTKEEYKEALKSPKWLAKRRKILKRDNYTCTKCGCENNLHVHHTYYLIDKMPWEVPNTCLITLCETCHEKEHQGRNISTFVRKDNTKNKKKPKKAKKKVNNRLRDLSKEDRQLQRKYDNLKSKGKLPESKYKPLIPKSKNSRKKK